MKRSIALLAATSLCSIAEGQTTVDRPELSPGDSWSYQRSDLSTKSVIGRYSTDVVAKTDKGYSIRNTVDGDIANLPQSLSLDLGRITTVEGKESDSRWLDFPLTVGKSWSAKELWRNTRGATGNEEIPYKVEGIEKITVPAGTFEAVKVKGYGQWNNTSSFSSGQVEITYWYALEVKNFVRFDRKNWFKGSIMDNWSTELTVFKVSKEGATGAK